jgi:uncharacterized protein
MSLTQFSKQKVIILETYKKNGDPVKCPVWVVEENGVFYVRSDVKSWKVKRIRRNPKVKLALGTWGGKVIGDWINGETRLVEGEGAKRILNLFRKKYGFMAAALNFYNKLRGRKYITFAIKVQ